ncbi:MAG: thioredoxin domain-containing protein, partial [Euryarchaeota archaeon]|nr:thioredoxin domain-containing protein [Euryarchaeota archaeon]
MRKTTETSPNRLIRERSPYLLQHAFNPVDWYPWGEEAFERAMSEDKPVFLSIGYSSCHWCHVMERESFEDDETAELMNRAFVCVKVDREERPDLDEIYMAACQMMTGGGGWPLTLILTPDLKPFFAGTYLPRESAHGRIGMRELVPAVERVWREQRGRAEETGERVAAALKETERSQGGAVDEEVLDAAYERLLAAFDEEHGGFGDAPKFPTPTRLTFLLRYWKRKGDEEALRMVERTLRSMRSGGIYDHLGHGFHRYATDDCWHLPHFEKMLYDQALLAIAYAEAFQATGNGEHVRTMNDVIAYVLREMRSPEGGFFSAEDADSEGVEGKFYLWSEDEIRSALTSEEAAAFLAVYDLGASDEIGEGNGRDGMGVLRMKRSSQSVAASLDLREDELEDVL